MSGNNSSPDTDTDTDDAAWWAWACGIRPVPDTACAPMSLAPYAPTDTDEPDPRTVPCHHPGAQVRRAHSPGRWIVSTPYAGDVGCWAPSDERTVLAVLAAYHQPGATLADQRRARGQRVDTVPRCRPDDEDRTLWGLTSCRHTAPNPIPRCVLDARVCS